jgi:hypothetical protein
MYLRKSPYRYVHAFAAYALPKIEDFHRSVAPIGLQRYW